jgi:ribosome biogenesis protein UTP30
MVAQVRSSSRTRSPKESKTTKTPKKNVEVKKNVDDNLVTAAVAALLKHHEKTSADKNTNFLLGTDVAIQVQIGLEIAPLRPSPKPIRIMIPNPIFKVNNTDDDTGLEEPEVCLIVKEESKAWVQELIAKFPEHMGCVKKVLGLQSLRTKHSEFKQRRELMHKYTVFMADDRILPMLTKALGKDFLRAKKQPIPIALTRKEALPFAILKALSATHMTLSQGTCVTVRAGNTGMTADKLAANVAAICAAATIKLPRKWANVRSIAVKTPISVSLPIYNKTPEELVKIAKMAGIKSVWKDTIATTKDKTTAESSKDDKDVDTKEKKRKVEKLAAKSPLLRALKKQKQKEGEETKEKVVESKKAKKDKKVDGKAGGESPNKKTKRATEEPEVVEKVQKKRRTSTASEKAEAEPKKVQKSAEKVTKKVEKSAEKTKKVEKSDEKVTKKVVEKKSGSDDAFIAANKFKGSKKGYVFKRDKTGVGYYKDAKPVVDKMAMEAIARMQSRKGNKGAGGKQAGGNRRGRR